MSYLLLNRFYNWMKIHNLDKHRTMLKNLCFRKWKQQKHNNKRKLQSKLPRYITTTNYLAHSPNILEKKSKHELSQLTMKNLHGLIQMMLWILMQKSLTKKAQFHLHRLAEGAIKYCYGILTKKYTDISTGRF